MLTRTVLLLLTATAVRAQSIPGAVLAKREPHHHPVFEDSTLRVLRVHISGHDTTLLHEHDPDYFWIALGASSFVNAKPGVPDAIVNAPDLSIHYTPGKFAHVARNPGTKPFNNVTVELLEAQTNVHNLCERAIADKPLDCPAPPPKPRIAFAGATVNPAFASAETRVSLVTIAPGAAMTPVLKSRGTWIIALDSAVAGRALVLNGGPAWIGGTARAPADKAWTLENRSKQIVRAIVVERF
jgi:hypothetical protein